MELVFRKTPPASSENLAGQTQVRMAPGEMVLVPAAADQRERSDLSQFVLEKGPAALLHGTEPTRQLVLDADPKFDDMLAAAFVSWQSEGRPLPAGCEAFARYAALLREGIRPTAFPLENSLEGIFLAIRGLVQKPLTDPETAAQFSADWARLANVIYQAAERRDDPFTTPFFSKNGAGEGSYALRSLNWFNPASKVEGDFAREKIFLTRDMAIYRQDFAQGESWLVRLPGSAGKEKGLLLRQPKSVLFKYWTRSPCPAPMGGPYQFLAVTWGHGQWVFSTSTSHKVSLKPLADILQAAEKKQAPARAEQDPWLAGNPPHMVVTSPRAGTQLPDATVLRLTRKWCRAQYGQRMRALARLAPLLTAVLAIVVALLLIFRPAPSSRSNPLLEIHDLHVLTVGVSKYEHLGESYNLPNAGKDADALAGAFKKLKGELCKEVFMIDVLKDQDATRDEIINTSLNFKLLKQHALTKHSLVVIAFSGHGFIEPGSNRYHFAPSDYDILKPGTTGIYWDELQRYLKGLPCPVFLVFDTCHSGALNEGELNDPKSPKNPLNSIQKSVKEYGSDNGLVVMAACAGYQKANDTVRWGHGALTLALLEGMEGKCLYAPKSLPRTPLPAGGSKGIITLRDLDLYVTDRVEVLSSEITAHQNRGQSVHTFHTDNIALEQIPIAVYEK